MAGPLLLLLALVLLAPAALVIGLLAYAATAGAERTGLHRGALTARAGGIAAALAVAGAVAGASLSGIWPGGGLGLGALVLPAPLLGGIVLLVAIAIGERSLPADTPRRSASLLPRTATTLLPRAATALARTAPTRRRSSGYLRHDEPREPGEGLTIPAKPHDVTAVALFGGGGA